MHLNVGVSSSSPTFLFQEDVDEEKANEGIGGDEAGEVYGGRGCFVGGDRTRAMCFERHRWARARPLWILHEGAAVSRRAAIKEGHR